MYNYLFQDKQRAVCLPTKLSRLLLLPMRIFFGGPLTDLKNPDKTKAFYKKLAGVAQANGYEHYWAFLNGTDPVLNPVVSPQEVFQTDLRELEKSDLFIPYVGEPSTGTGQEIEFARNHNIPVYILYEKGTTVTRMVLGDPNIRGKIEFDSEADAMAQLDALLKKLKQ